MTVKDLIRILNTFEETDEIDFRQHQTGWQGDPNFYTTIGTNLWRVTEDGRVLSSNSGLVTKS